jgi:autophagy-related protein 18
MNFNLMSTLLAVSSAHETVHIFKLGPQKPSSSSPSKNGQQPESPEGSVDDRDGKGPDGGYEAYIDERKKSGSVS